MNRLFYYKAIVLYAITARFKLITSKKKRLDQNLHLIIANACKH
jgi:hypothetical protein